MGRTGRKLMKKTRLERLEMHINRLTQFNTNAMHEVGKLAVALRFYADPEVWEGDFDKEGKPIVIWKHTTDGPKIARDVLTSLGLPWDKMPVKEGGPVQEGRKSVLKSLAADMRAEKEGLEEDDKRYQIGRYDAEGKVVPIQAEAEDEAEDEADQKSEEPPKTDPA